MAGISDYYGRVAEALEVLDKVLPEKPGAEVPGSALTSAFASIRTIVETGERGAVHDEVLDRLSRSDLSDKQLAGTVLTMSTELPLVERELA